ncbi:MAG TPA: helix-turn-helix transcriptional regulator [Pedobacter sp.]|uniref:response regulator transcription factor n=1 Tax=Pedobacter sp. TaxID=1411316 RepID=UPI002BBA53C1|nr:helix-turn-helix transcriptional regulator [Pedobacter sp.]HMI03711.1 helix-turn-helix transcriptional regulator [Pedobacter sp.]
MEHSCQAQLLSLGNSIHQHSLRIEDIGDYIPGSVMVQDLSSMTNTYMNQTGCDILKHSTEELALLGPAYFSTFFPAEEINILKSELQHFAMESDTGKIHSFFQRVRPDAQSEYKWYFTTSRLYPSDEFGEGLKMMHIAVPADTLSYAGRRLSNLVQDDALIRKNLHKFILLTLREKEVIRLIVEGKSSVEIANGLFLSIHTVNNHRKNIIHKLEVTSLSQLIKFAVAFGII